VRNLKEITIQLANRGTPFLNSAIVRRVIEQYAGPSNHDGTYEIDTADRLNQIAIALCGQRISPASSGAIPSSIVGSVVNERFVAIGELWEKDRMKGMSVHAYSEDDLTVDFYALYASIMDIQ